MKVFMCRRQGGYGGGLAVVAANSVEEAFKTFCEDPDNDWMVDKYTDNFKYTDDHTKWFSDYYPIDEWFECKVLTANVNKPCVIMEVRAGGVIGLDRNRGIICLHEMQPIQLTKEFFEKNGFILIESLDYYDNYFRSEDMRIDVYESSKGWVVCISNIAFSTAFCKCLKCVHELQNAYYVSTGEELEVKL